ncbi:hypothetical protein SISSUDRAFT_203969 [Sistotremastrum suecicum HHB10207 ss-3]|uniref:Uncharacterized protein n=1 Tax=Sistotremastrum suecicum HHB10207 ss-3 TaxID=1314776 RepID=A0A166GLP4_9AGAM|nr:hypothetical protein SISSUDRAFT_203969 [Sistotremastrum suecicum HHB10207 ss-3]
MIGSAELHAHAHAHSAIRRMRACLCHFCLSSHFFPQEVTCTPYNAPIINRNGNNKGYSPHGCLPPTSGLEARSRLSWSLQTDTRTWTFPKNISFLAWRHTALSKTIS